MTFSANLGFLWTELKLVDAIRAAAAAGFDAVECHWPYDVAAAEVLAVLRETGLPMLSINTARGDVEADEFGLSALPGRAADARAAIDQALEYAAAVAAPNVHVMAGNARGDAAAESFRGNLRYACERAAPLGLTILVEPLNAGDAPGYFLRDSAQASALIEEIGLPNLRLMFDCYHVQITEGDVLSRLHDLLPVVGHIQIAAVPHRGEPDSGELDYGPVMRALAEAGYDRPIGAEYRPAAATGDSLGWMAGLRQPHGPAKRQRD